MKALIASVLFIILGIVGLQNAAANCDDIDNLLLLMAPPYNNLDNLKFGLSILEPIVYRGNVRTEIIENNIGKTVLDIAAEPELDPALRLRAETGILNSLANNPDVSGVFKEEMGEVLENIVFNEPASGEDRQAINDLKLNSLVSLNRIAEDSDVSAAYKEQLVDPLLGLKDNNMFNLDVFVLCDTLAADPAVSPEAKEKLLSPLLTKAGELQSTEPDKAAVALDAAAEIVGDAHVSGATKETAVSPALAIAGDESLEDTVRLKAVQILYNAAFDNSVSTSSKENIVHGIGTLTPQNNDLEAKFDVLILGALAAVLYDKDVDPVKKEKALQKFAPLLSSEGMPQTDMVYTLQNIGSVIQDAEVGASVKEQVVQPLEKLITDNLESMQTQASWFEVLVAGLGDLTVIMNDPQVPQATRDGINTWISGLNIFSTETKQIWDEYNTVVVSEKNAFLNANTIAAIKNVLASQPENFRPGIIKLQDSGYGKNKGYYDFSTTVIEINAVNDISTVPHYEKSLLYMIGYYIKLGGRVDAELLTAFDPLWDSTDSYLDCSDPDGYQGQDEDISVIFADYVSDTENLVGRAVLLADNPAIQKDTLLLKVAGIAQFYSHTVPPSSEKYTYIFSFNSRTGGITRQEVAFTNQDINKGKYFLPDNTAIVKTDSFPITAAP